MKKKVEANLVANGSHHLKGSSSEPMGAGRVFRAAPRCIHLDLEHASIARVHRSEKTINRIVELALERWGQRPGAKRKIKPLTPQDDVKQAIEASDA